MGGGLSGLALAHMLAEAGMDFRLIEARARLGGRILSLPSGNAPDAHDAPRYDMGPAWFWSGQPRIAALAAQCDLAVFEQHATGKLVFQNGQGQIRRDLDMATMAGALRIDGGMARLIEGLAVGLPDACVLTGHRLDALTRQEGRICTTIAGATSSHQLTADRVVLALPPRVIAERVAFTPALPATALVAMRAIPTWMAGHAKAVATYDRPFWRDAGLSGDAISHRGPMVEIHDASPMRATQGALFGFLGIPADVRRQAGDALRPALLDQFTGLFGPAAAHPTDLFLSDWAEEPFTATPLDDKAPEGHPAYGTPMALRDLWDGRVILSSTEMAPSFGGFLEGALEAAEQSMAIIRG